MCSTLVSVSLQLST